MHLKHFFQIFGMIFLAELGDKTQLATFLFASHKDKSKVVVFAASAAALVVCSAVAVLLGDLICRYVPQKYMSWGAGAGFIIIGILTIYKA